MNASSDLLNELRQNMRKQKKTRICFEIVQILVFLMLFSGCQTAYGAPPATLDPKDLVGQWKIRYSSHESEQLIISSGGAFKQIHEQNQAQKFYEFGANAWWLERLSGNFVRIHLHGAKNFSNGAIIKAPDIVYDPFTDQVLTVKDELILQIRLDAKGELILHHLLSDPDEGLPLIGGETMVYRRVRLTE